MRRNPVNKPLRYSLMLTLASSQVSTQPLSHSSFSTGSGEKKWWKLWRVEVKTRRLLASCHDRQRNLGIIKLIYCQLKYIWVVRNIGKKWKQLFLPIPTLLFSQTQLHSFIPGSFLSHPKQSRVELSSLADGLTCVWVQCRHDCVWQRAVTGYFLLCF